LIERTGGTPRCRWERNLCGTEEESHGRSDHFPGPNRCSQSSAQAAQAVRPEQGVNGRSKPREVRSSRASLKPLDELKTIGQGVGRGQLEIIPGGGRSGKRFVLVEGHAILCFSQEEHQRGARGNHKNSEIQKADWRSSADLPGSLSGQLRRARALSRSSRLRQYPKTKKTVRDTGAPAPCAQGISRWIPVRQPAASVEAS